MEMTGACITSLDTEFFVLLLHESIFFAMEFDSIHSGSATCGNA